MPVYHSSLNDSKNSICCNASVLPLKTLIRGPAPPATAETVDIIDEAIEYFRANVLFRQYDPQGPADRVLCYLTIYIGECIRLLAKYPKDKKEAIKQMTTFSMGNFAIPGEKAFGLGGFFAAPKDRTESDLFRGYFRQLREETSKRIVEKVYDAEGNANKFWLAFGKKKFMNIAIA